MNGKVCDLGEEEDEYRDGGEREERIVTQGRMNNEKCNELILYRGLPL